jgi:hypothetical protein
VPQTVGNSGKVPPGQAKKSDEAGALPPGQAKKYGEAGD